jgi:hypothetical protein
VDIIVRLKTGETQKILASKGWSREIFVNLFPRFNAPHPHFDAGDRVYHAEGEDKSLKIIGFTVIYKRGGWKVERFNIRVTRSASTFQYIKPIPVGKDLKLYREFLTANFSKDSVAVIASNERQSRGSA